MRVGRIAKRFLAAVQTQNYDQAPTMWLFSLLSVLMMDTTFAAKSCVSSTVNSTLVLILDGSGSIELANFPKLKAFAVDVVTQLPIDEVTIRVMGRRGYLSDTVTENRKKVPYMYPSDGRFVSKNESLLLLPDVEFPGGGTATGEAVRQAQQLLEGKTDSFNMVMIMTDGKSTDGSCRVGQCNPSDGGCYDPNGRLVSGACTLQQQAPKLLATKGYNSNVTVIAVGFGKAVESELKFLAGSENPQNVLYVKGDGATDGLIKLKEKLDALVETVCSALPQDCVLTYSEWSECGGPDLDQSRTRELQGRQEPRNGGKSCSVVLTEACPANLAVAAQVAAGIIVPLIVGILLALLVVFLIGALLAWSVRKKRAEEVARKAEMRKSAARHEKDIVFKMNDDLEAGSGMDQQDTMQKLVAERDRLQELNIELADAAGDTPMVIAVVHAPDDVVAQIKSLKTDNDRLRAAEDSRSPTKRRKKNKQQTAFGQTNDD